MKTANNLKKNFMWNTIGTALNSFNSLFLLIIVTRINGINDAGIFTYAFSMSLLFNIIGIYSGRVYQVTDRSKLTDSDYLVCKFITCLLMLIASILFVLINNYELYKTMIILIFCLYRTFEAFSECLYAYYQKEDNLYKVGFSLFIKNILVLLIFFLVNLITKNLLFSTISITVTYFIIMLIYDMRIVKKQNIKFIKIEKEHLQIFFKAGFLTFFLTFLSSLLNNIPRYIIDYNLTNELNTIWGILIMPATMMLLIGQFCLHPLLNEFFELYKNKKYDEYKRKVYKTCGILFIFGLLVLIAGYLFGIPFFQIVYGISLNDYKVSLMIILFGSVLYAIATIIYNLLIAIRDVRSQVITYIILVILSAILNIYMINEYKIVGASYAYLIIMALALLIYIVLFEHNLKKENNKWSSDNMKDIHTFVVLAYKESDKLESCIKSVLNQSLKTNVVIATSTPNDYIKNIAKKYDLEIIVNKGQKGIGYDFDFASNCVKSKLVTIAHQDDIYDYDYAKSVVEKYQQYPKSLIIFTDYYEIKNDQKETTNLNLKIKRFLLLPLRIHPLSKFNFIKRTAISLGNAICCPAVTFVRENVPKDKFKCDMKCDIDWYAWEKLSKLKGNFIFIPKKLMGHRIHKESTTTKILEDNKRSIEDYEMFQKFWPKWIAKLLTKFYKNSEKSNSK